MKRLSPEELESKYVNEVYDVIAPHFNHTRYRAWPSVEKYVESLDPNSLLIDVGCGNGRNLCIGQRRFDIGTDFSMPLCKMSQERNVPIFRASALNLPIRSNFFDHVICIAVIHHFSTEERRIQCLREISRILRIGGRAYVTAWATKQRKKEYIEPDQMVPWNVRKDFDKDQHKFDRFYHFFVQGEFGILLEHVPELKLIEERFETGNWEVILEKKSV